MHQRMHLNFETLFPLCYLLLFKFKIIYKGYIDINKDMDVQGIITPSSGLHLGIL